MTWPVRAGAADPADDGEHQILGADTRSRARPSTRISIDFDCRIQQRLGRQHMLDLAGADAEGERAERAMRGGVAVAADQGRAGQGEALLGADDMDDPLRPRRVGEVGDAEIGDIGLQRLELGRAFGVGDRDPPAVARHARRRRQIMVGHGQSEVGPAHAPALDPQAVERLRRRHLMDQVPVDIEQAGAVVAPLNHMGVPDLLVEGARPLAHPQQPRFMAISSLCASRAVNCDASRSRTLSPSSEQRALPCRSVVQQPPRSVASRLSASKRRRLGETEAEVEQHRRAGDRRRRDWRGSGRQCREPTRGSARTGRARTRRCWPTAAGRSSRRPPTARPT